jgi:beta-lactamase class C
MGKWLQALLGNSHKTLSEDILTKVSTPIIYTPLKWQYTRYWKSFRERYYSLGWRIYDYKGRRIIYHGGYVRGYRAEIAFCPEENVGMAFLQNSPNSLASKSIPTFFDMFLEEKKVESSP